MLKDFKLPDLGEGVHEGRIIRVMVKPGEHVREDQPLMEVETDKAAVEVPSPFEGVVSKVHIHDKQLVHVGDVMFTFEVGARANAPEARTSAPRGPAASAAGHAPSHGDSTHLPAPSLRGRGSQATAPSNRITPASPAVRKRARALGLDLNTINGGGPAGRVRMQDLEVATAIHPLPSREGTGGWVKTPALPTAPIPRRSSRETASGPAPAAPPVSSPFAQSSAAEVREELSQARKTIALNMVQSWTTIPHVTDCEDADVTELDRLRQGHNITLREGEHKLSLLPFVIRAVAMALTRQPIFNSTFDDKTSHIIYKRAINLAIGMHTERGLIAPVLREADKMNVAQIAAWLTEWTIRGREAKFAVNDLRGGTYTISNAGAMGGSRYSTPIITPGQAAVLALGRTRWEPRAIEQQIVPRYIMPLSHSFDHRIIDGGQEIAFQRDVIGALENPARLLLQLDVVKRVPRPTTAPERLSPPWGPRATPSASAWLNRQIPLKYDESNRMRQRLTSPDFQHVVSLVERRREAYLHELLERFPHALEVKSENGSTVLIHFIDCGSANDLEFVLKLGARVNHKDDVGYTVLQLVIDLRPRDLEKLRVLLAHGARIHQIGTGLDDALHLAALRGWVEAVRLFLDHGASINTRSRDHGRQTALMYAAHFGRADVVQLLLERGARRDLLDDSRKTAAQIAEREGHRDIATLIRGWRKSK